MKTRLLFGIYIILFALVTLGFVIARNKTEGHDYYWTVRTHTLVTIEFLMLGGSIFLFTRLSNAFANILFPHSRNENGSISIRPFGSRWRHICFTDIVRAGLFLFLVLAHLSFLFYYTWVSTEPNLLALFSLYSVGLYLHLIVFVTLVEIWYHISRFATSHKIGEFPLVSSLFSFATRRRDELTLAAFLCSIILVAGGMHTTLSDPVLNKVYVQSKHLSADAPPIKIALLTDLHIGPSVGRKRIEKIVEVTNKVHPDIIAISGDLADGFLINLREAAQPLCSLNAKYGVYFATGNHEYMHGNVEEWFNFLRSCNITVLHNENRHISVDSNTSLCMAGIDDLYTLRIHVPGHGMNPDKALSGCRPGEVQVLLAHQPNAARKVLSSNLAENLDLILSGHTHAGQMYMFAPIVWLANAYTRGLYYEPLSDTHVYVSAGVNFFGPPVKMFGTCEIIELLIVPYTGKAQ